MFVCMYVCAYVCMCVCVCMHVCMHECMYLCKIIFIYFTIKNITSAMRSVPSTVEGHLVELADHLLHRHFDA
jgi:hypothetical protein